MEGVMKLNEILLKKYGKSMKECSNQEVYYGLLDMVQAMAREKENHTGKKKLYYISAEFLIGKLLSNNLINLGIYEDVKSLLEENGTRTISWKWRARSSCGLLFRLYLHTWFTW